MHYLLAYMVETAHFIDRLFAIFLTSKTLQFEYSQLYIIEIGSILEKKVATARDQK